MGQRTREIKGALIRTRPGLLRMGDRDDVDADVCVCVCVCVAQDDGGGSQGVRLRDTCASFQL
jgi:hypothetical protein